ncbi:MULTISPECIES: cobalamin B12-binding domain-containing protein [Dehalobacter]|jgi:methanogenic corrinoid protein MtbC1|uniref:Cobalamin-binding protein n=1 Tax=Dehalobacter restrictus TaxID=55583 RepID=A0A857DG80_9FIRM|nr:MULTISPECIES: cobalamin-dependent protein [Dehalobacter]MCG1025843.1 cobalamin-dependent protein [Dehalobacter sp.]OCZ50960.1 cobalamin-binding protein [Dehalobacter sp. TeCB1]QGZ99896.1 cobalamin-binding protein [Dehalobacter restrictus]
MNLDAIATALGELDEEKVLSLLNTFIQANPSEDDAKQVVAACQSGMSIVGDQFEKGEYFVGDLIFAGELLANAIETLKPFLSAENEGNRGKIVLGTVAGDLHDIGKNIFRSMAEAAGFNVLDLGIDQPASEFVRRVKEVNPEIVGMSGVLTLALESMKNTVDALKEAGLRENVKIIIGGNPVTNNACEQIGADAFTTNAAEGVKICQKWVS